MNYNKNKVKQNVLKACMGEEKFNKAKEVFNRLFSEKQERERRFLEFADFYLHTGTDEKAVLIVKEKKTGKTETHTF